MANYATTHTHGDPLAPGWTKDNLTSVKSPSGAEFRVHKDAAESFTGFLAELEGTGYKVNSSGGFNYRNVRGGSRLSQHAFGNAIDINAPANPRMKRGDKVVTDMPANVAEIATKHGLEWGGSWARPDAMHFEWKGGGTSAPGSTSLKDIDVGPSAYSSDDSTPLSVSSAANPLDAIKAQKAAEESAAGPMDTFGQAMDRSWVDPLKNIWNYGDAYFNPEADWKGPSDADLKAAQARGVGVEDTGRLVDTWSREHYERTIDDVLRRNELDKNLQGNGWAGSAINVATTVLSPETLAAVGIGVATDGVMAPALFASRTGALASAARFGISGAVGNVAAEGAISTARGEDFSGDEAWEALLWGAGIGAVAGGFASPALTDEATRLSRAANTGMRKVLADAEAHARGPAPTVDPAPGLVVDGGSSVGAAQASVTRDISERTPIVFDQDAPGGALAQARLGVTGQLSRSDNPVVRAIYDSFAPENVGKADGGVVPISAWERFETLNKTWVGGLSKTYEKAWTDWLQDVKPSGVDRATGAARGDFNRQISDYVRTTDETLAAEFHPAVREAGEAWRRLSGDILDHLQNPLKGQGGVGESVRGAANLSKDKHYLPRVLDNDAIVAADQRFGTDTLETFLRDAFHANNPDVDPAFAAKLAKGWLHSVRSRAYGAEEPFSLFAGSGDLEALKAGMEDIAKHLDEIGAAGADMKITAEEIEATIAKMRAGEEKTGRTGHLKRRTTFSEEYAAYLRPKEGGQPVRVRFADLLENDFETLSSRYIRQMAGNVALGAMRVVNPSAPEELLLDGIRSQADFDRLLSMVDRTGASARIAKGTPNPADAAKSDRDNLTFLYHALKGVPPETTMSAATQRQLRRVADYNFVRLMNQTGFPAVSEIGNVIASTTFKAFISQMPAFRDVLARFKAGEWGDDLSREIEAMSGIASDPLLGRQGLKAGFAADDPFAPAPTAAGRIGAGVDRALEVGKRVTGTISGLRPITELTQMWATRIAAQTFADMTMGTGKAFDRLQLKSLGLDDKTLDLVLDRVKAYATVRKGETGGKLAALNLDRWTKTPNDLKARDALVMALGRFGRRMVQENDPGLMAKWMSKPTARLLLQFRAFTIGAYEKQLLHNVNVFRQGEHRRAITYFAASAFSAALVYVAQSYARSLTQTDPEGYRERALQPDRILGAMISRSSWSSVLPDAADPLISLATGSPLFNGYRSSGLQTGVINAGSVPAIDLANSVYGVIHDGLSSARDDRELSQREFRNGWSTLPFQNSLPAMWALAHLVEDRPEFAPQPARD